MKTTMLSQKPHWVIMGQSNIPIIGLRILLLTGFPTGHDPRVDELYGRISNSLHIALWASNSTFVDDLVDGQRVLDGKGWKRSALSCGLRDQTRFLERKRFLGGALGDEVESQGANFCRCGRAGEGCVWERL